MKIRILNLSILVLLMFITGCDSSRNDYQKSSLKEWNTLPNVSIRTTEDSYNTSVKNINILFSNLTDQKMAYGDRYTLEYFNDGNWVIIPFNTEIAWVDILYFVDNHSSKEITYHVKENIGFDSLKAGKYRIIIDIRTVNKTPSEATYSLIAEFFVK